jgi:hypothetical protein
MYSINIIRVVHTSAHTLVGGQGLAKGCPVLFNLARIVRHLRRRGITKSLKFQL